MATIDIYDPALCCSSGVCGESVDQALVDAAATVSAARTEGIEVRRHNLANDPLAFASEEAVRALLESEGAQALPAVVVAGKIVLTGAYPSLEQLRTWAGGSAHIISLARPERPTLPLTSGGCCGGGTGCC